MSSSSCCHFGLVFLFALPVRNLTPASLAHGTRIDQKPLYPDIQNTILTCSDLLTWPTSALDPCRDLSFQAYLKSLDINEKACTSPSKCQLKCKLKSPAASADALFLEKVEASATEMMTWEAAINKASDGIAKDLEDRRFFGGTSPSYSTQARRHVQGKRSLAVSARKTHVWAGSDLSSPTSPLDLMAFESIDQAQGGTAKERISSKQVGQVKAAQKPALDLGCFGTPPTNGGPSSSSAKLRKLRGKPGVNPYTETDPVFVKELGYSRELYGPLSRLQEMISAEIPWNKNVFQKELMEEFKETRFLLRKIFEDILADRPNDMKTLSFRKLRSENFRNYRFQMNALNLLVEAQEVYMQATNRLSALLPETFDLERFEITSELLQSLEYGIVIPVAKRLERQLSHELPRFRERIYEHESMRKHEWKRYSREDSNPAFDVSSPIEADLQKASGPIDNKEANKLLDMAERKSHWDDTLQNLRQLAKELKKLRLLPPDNVNEKYKALQEELKAMRTHLSKTGLARFRFRNFEMDSEPQGLESVDTVLQDMIISIEVIKSLQSVLLGNKQGIATKDSDVDDMGSLMYDKLTHAISKSLSSVVGRLKSVLDFKAGPTSTTIDADLEALPWSFVNGVENHKGYLALLSKNGQLAAQIRRSFQAILRLEHVRFSPENTAQALENEITRFLARIHQKSDQNVLARVLEYHITGWQDSLKRAHSNYKFYLDHGLENEVLMDYFDFELEKMGEKINGVYTKLTKVDNQKLVPTQPSPAEDAPVHHLTKRALETEQISGENKNKFWLDHTQSVVKKGLLSVIESKFQSALKLPLTSSSGMIKLVKVLGSGQRYRFQKYMEAMRKMMGLFMSFELLKQSKVKGRPQALMAAGQITLSSMSQHDFGKTKQVAGNEKFKVELANKLWKIYQPQQGYISKLVQEWVEFGAVFGDLMNGHHKDVF